MEDLISVIVPIYNVESYLEQCIKSIINQTYKNIEIILIDDGSTDKSPKICDKYKQKDSRIIVVHKQNTGVSATRNIGLELSKGKWIAFVDSDDWIEKEYLEELILNAKKEKADISLCGYNRIISPGKKKVILNTKKEITNSSEYLIKSLNPQTGYGFSPIKIIKKQTIKDIRFNKNLIVGEDAFFNIEISANINKAFYCNKALYNYRNNSESAVKKFDCNYARKYLKSMQECKKYIFKKYKSNDIIQNYYNFVAFHVMLVAVNFCYHPKNKNKNKKKLLKDICNYYEFREGIEKSNYNNISLTRKITLFTLKHKLYFLTSIICIIRQKQNRIGNEK